MDGFSESVQTRYKKLKKGEKREDHNQDGISIKLKFFKNIHSKDKNSILQFQKISIFEILIKILISVMAFLIETLYFSESKLASNSRKIDFFGDLTALTK